MKKKILILLVGAGALLLAAFYLIRPTSIPAGPAPTSPPTPPVPNDRWTQLGQAIQVLRYWPGFAPHIDLVEADIPKYRLLAESEFAQISSADVLDVMSMAHTRERQTLDPVIKQSQARVKASLEANNYPLIGIEGFTGEMMSLDDVFGSLMHEIRTINPNESEAKVREYFDRDLLAEYATLGYLRDHPEARGVGIEMRALHQLHDNFIACASQLPQTKQMDSLNWQLSQARSEVAVARMLAAMHRSQTHRAVLVIGFAHLPRITQIYKERGISGQITNTVR